MSLDKVLETVGAILHPESGRDKSPIPEAR